MSPRVSMAAYQDKSLLPPDFHDVRDVAAKLAIKDLSIRKKGSGRTRTWDKVTGICLHQTATLLGERPNRWARLGAHIGVTRSGKIIWVHDFDKIMYHGNGWNKQTVGIEIDGRYPGVKGNLKTFWKPKSKPNTKPTPLSQETVEASQEVIRWICEFVKRHGGRVKFLVAHRQSSGTRRSDPGSEIWQDIAISMQRVLKLEDGGPGFKIGKGRPIPEEWNPKYVGQKY